MKTELLFSDETYEYVKPAEPEAGDEVTIRFRTAANDAERVEYIAEGKEPQSMLRVSFDEFFDYYEIRITADDDPIRYYFKIYSGNENRYYDRLGASDAHDDAFNFCIIPGFKTPDWAKGAVMYQIFVDRFRNGSDMNGVRDGEYIYLDRPVRKVSDWNRIPELIDVGNFYGGDLQGVWEKLDYLKDIGVEVLYFNPLFESPSNHKYDTRDYDHIDARLSNRQDPDTFFAAFVSAAHERGIKVIMDGVFNHCGSFNKWMGEKKHYFKWFSDGEYESWWENRTLPKLNYEGSPELEQEILDIAKKWLLPPYSADGWRLDVAADLGHSPEYNHSFWKKFRNAVKEVRPDALIIAEHYGEPTAWLRGDEWDTVMNYDAFMDPVSYFITGMEKHSDREEPELFGNAEVFMKTMLRARSFMPMPAYMTAMNQLDNHDHSRFLTRTNRKTGRLADAGAAAAEEGTDKALMKLAIVLQMTWQGAPTLYYGDEAGVCGWTDPDSRRTYPWGSEDKELLDFYKNMIAFHKKSKALRYGSLIPVSAGGGVISYIREYEGERILTAVNMGDTDIIFRVPDWILGHSQKVQEVSVSKKDFIILPIQSAQ